MGVDLAREVQRWFRHRVELGDLRVYQVQVERRQVRLKLVQPARSDNCRCNALVAPDPGQGNGGRGCANLVGHGAQRVDDHMIPLARHARHWVRLVSTEPTPSRRNLPDRSPCLSGDQAMTPMPLSCAIGINSPSAIRVSTEYSELHSGDRRSASEGAGVCACETFQAVRDLKSRCSGPSRGHEVVEPAQGLLDRRGPIPEMQPVDVDIVGLEAPQRRFALLHQGLPTAAAAARKLRFSATAAKAVRSAISPLRIAEPLQQ
jgi:hypothetical protein